MQKDYDLKLKILEHENALKCIKNILEKTKYKSFEEIFSDNSGDYLERYLLFKAQGKLGAGFECDKADIVMDFFKEKFDYQGEYMDTLISMQYIWGMILRILWKKDAGQIAFEKDSKEYKFFLEEYGEYKDYNTGRMIPRIDGAQKFIYELLHLEEIRKALGDELYFKFNEFAHYYHTIGNISPCPESPFNREKGFAKGCYDRLDLFMKTDLFKENQEWIKWFSENKDVYYLDHFMENDLGDKLIKLKDDFISGKYNVSTDFDKVSELKDECSIYIDKVIEIIMDRKKVLMNK